MNKKRNAFTLIELLAIIVILAIIAVITVPIILNIIENSKKGAITDSAYGYKDAINKTYVTELSKPNQEGLKLNGIYEVQSDGTLVPADGYSFGVTNYNTLPVSLSGEKPTSGTLTYSNNVLTSGTLIIGDYTATYSNGSFTAVKTSTVSNGIGTSESETPSNPYLTTFDGSYTYIAPGASTEFGTLFDPQWTVYARNDGTTNEVCAVFGSVQASTVCIKKIGNGDWNTDFPEDYESEYPYNPSNTSLNGYTKAKLDEMLSKGANQCEVNYDSGYAGCSTVDGLACHINEYGGVTCYAADAHHYCVDDGCI